MTSSILQDAVAGRAKIVPWTVEQYHIAIDNGFISKDAAVELIDGFIVHKDRAAAGEDPMTIGDKHALIVQRLVRFAPSFDGLGAHLRIQQALTLSPSNEPEPDAALVRRSEEDYAARPPTAADALCVIEVSDSSLSRDLGAKLRNYAQAGVPPYVVADLVNERVLVHTQPASDSYASIVELHRGEIVYVPTGAARVSLPVDRLLP